MKNDKHAEDYCNECEQMFEDNVNGLVDEVEGYTRKDHHDKAEEVREAYDRRDGKEGLSRDNGGRADTTDRRSDSECCVTSGPAKTGR